MNDASHAGGGVGLTYKVHVAGGGKGDQQRGGVDEVAEEGGLIVVGGGGDGGLAFRIGHPRNVVAQRFCECEEDRGPSEDGKCSGNETIADLRNGHGIGRNGRSAGGRGGVGRERDVLRHHSVRPHHVVVLVRENMTVPYKAADHTKRECSQDTCRHARSRPHNILGPVLIGRGKRHNGWVGEAVSTQHLKTHQVEVHGVHHPSVVLKFPYLSCPLVQHFGDGIGKAIGGIARAQSHQHTPIRIHLLVQTKLPRAGDR
mmetsp:Transcript_23713/g.38999  ORF Transcript_23713/g.38999 Transcript_23713/m.38999 type:complete len:258 (-) Transcript_23713:1390-2163(-)